MDIIKDNQIKIYKQSTQILEAMLNESLYFNMEKNSLIIPEEGSGKNNSQNDHENKVDSSKAQFFPENEFVQNRFKKKYEGDF